MKENKITILDVSDEEKKKALNEFLNSLTEEEHKKAMSAEFDYLEE